MSQGKATASRVLIVDDSRSMRALISAVLESHFDCSSAGSGEEALQKVLEIRPEVVLSDLLMGDMNGLELCERLRANPETAGIPFILITSVTGDEERARGLERGADDYLYKPVRPRELLARVASLSRLRRTTLALEARTRELEESHDALEESHRRLRQTQDALVRSEKLATVGTLAAGIAHEINNPLAYVKAGVEAVGSLLDEAGQGRPLEPSVIEEMRQIGVDVAEGLSRIARIVRDLQDFSSERDSAVEPLDLTTELQRAWKLAAVRASARPELVLEIEDQARTLVALRIQLGQVLLNLFLNAVQAISQSQSPGWVRCTVRGLPGRVSITIEDSGPGIAEADLPRVFDPFFTTKGPGEGTGLGLSVTYGLMRSMGGSIEVQSPAGSGAVFTLELPSR